MIEVAMLFPLFLVGLLFFIWLGVMFNARSSLSAAVSNAVRLATTRGADNQAGEKIVGQDLISAIDAWHQNGSTSQTFEELMASPEINISDALYFYDSKSSAIFDDRTLRELPVTYAYTLAYVNEALRMSLGGYVRYPCDPEDISDTDPDDGAGCVGCVFLHPDYLNDAMYEHNGQRLDPPARVIALECKYQPVSRLLAPIQSLLTMITGNAGFARILVTNRQLVNMPQM